MRINFLSWGDNVLSHESEEHDRVQLHESAECVPEVQECAFCQDM